MENGKQTSTLASCPLAGVVGGKSSARGGWDKQKQQERNYLSP